MLYVSESFLQKAVGLISTLVLARVLVPEDFGLVAMATIFTGFLNLLANQGGRDYILRAESIDDDMVNTNWTINFMLRASIAMMIALSAPLVAKHFGDQRLINILYFYSFAALITALENPGLELLKREQNVLPIVINNIIGKTLAVITAITIALVYESYWALIIGLFISQATRAIGSYFIHSFRPWFCLRDYNCLLYTSPSPRDA